MGKDEIILSLKECLKKVAKKDFDNASPDDLLGLDSINRISLIVELEWVFDIEIDTADLEPEIFDSLNSLAGLIMSLVGDRV